MIYKLAKRLPALFYRSTQCFSKINDQRLNIVKNHSLSTQYQNLQPKISPHTINKWTLIEDQTNIKFLVQTGGFPGCADMGILFRTGTQNQTQQTAGSLSAFKNLVHIKPDFKDSIKNYEFLQQTGASMNFNYDVEHSYFSCSFFQQDQQQLIDNMLDLALRQKKLYSNQYPTMGVIEDINQHLRVAAFSSRGIGMPKNGLGNILTKQQFINFQRQQITPYGSVISLSNVQDYQNVIKQIKKKIKDRYPQFLKRKNVIVPKSQYKGGVYRVQEQNPLFNFGVVFPGCSSWSSKMELYNILRIILGSASSFSSGGPGKGMHSRCTKNLLNQEACIQSASFCLTQYSDTGLFGLVASGPIEEANDVMEVTLRQMANLVKPISSQQLQRAKNILIAGIYANVERQSDRLEQLTRQIYSYGRIKLNEFQQNIRAVTSRQIQDQMRDMFKKPPVLVLVGNKKTNNISDNKLYERLFRQINN